MDNVPVDQVAMALAVVVLSLIFVAVWPLGVIWSVNTLFRTDIPYTFSTWLATVLLLSIIRVGALSPEKR